MMNIQDNKIIDDPNLNLVNKFGHTVLHLAVLENRVKRVQELLSVDNKQIDVECQLGKTPLYMACKNEDTSIEIIEVLLKANADVNKKTLRNITPLHILCKNAANERKVQKLDLLLNTSSIYLDPRDDFNETPLIYLLENSDHRSMEMLLHCGADANVCNRNGRTPIMIAAPRADLKAIQILAPFVTDINHIDHDGRTALMLGTENFEITNTILSMGADPDIISVDDLKITALHLATNFMQPEIIRLLLPVTNPDILLIQDKLNILFLLHRHADVKRNTETIITCMEILLESNLNYYSFFFTHPEYTTDPCTLIILPYVMDVSLTMWEKYKNAVHLFFSKGIVPIDSVKVFETYYVTLLKKPFTSRAIELLDILVNYNLDMTKIDLRDSIYSWRDSSLLYNFYFIPYTLLNDTTSYINECFDKRNERYYHDQEILEFKTAENYEDVMKTDNLQHSCREVLRSAFKKYNLTTQTYFNTLRLLKVPKKLRNYIQYKFE